MPDTRPGQDFLFRTPEQLRETAAEYRRRLGLDRSRPFIAQVVASPRYGEVSPDGREVPLRGIPDLVMHGASAEYRALLYMLERCQADLEGTGLGDEAKAMLRRHRRPREAFGGDRE
jgi:hypothetical protein